MSVSQSKGESAVLKMLLNARSPWNNNPVNNLQSKATAAGQCAHTVQADPQC